MESSKEKLYCYKFNLTEHCDIIQALHEWMDKYNHHPIYERIKIIVENMNANEKE